MTSFCPLLSLSDRCWAAAQPWVVHIFLILLHRDRVTEHNATFCSPVLLFLTLSHGKFQNPTQKSSRSLLILFEGSISEVAAKGELRQDSNCSKCTSAGKSTCCNHYAEVEEMENPKHNGVGKVCITLIFLFQDMNCGAEASLTRWKQASYFSKSMLKKSTLHGVFQGYLCENIDQISM